MIRLQQLIDLALSTDDMPAAVVLGLLAVCVLTLAVLAGALQ